MVDVVDVAGRVEEAMRVEAAEAGPSQCLSSCQSQHSPKAYEERKGPTSGYREAGSRRTRSGWEPENRYRWHQCDSR